MTSIVYTKEQQKTIANIIEKRRLMALTASPYPPKTPDTLAWAFMKMQMELRLNMRSQQAEWRTGAWVEDDDDDSPWFGPDWQWNEWQPLTGGAKAYLRDQMQKQVDVKFSREGLEDALEAVLYEREVDPLLEYFKSLPKVVGRNILPKMLSTCMKVDTRYEKLAEWASVYMFLGVVWRTYEPATKLDEIPILVGPGGIGKSTLPAMAVPQQIPRLYGSGLELNGTPQRMVESILGRAIVEISEMVGASTGDMSRIKDFLSRTSDDSVRLAYKRGTEPLPRRCIMIGTADRERFLPNDGNLRRFVPIVLGKGDARKVRTYMTKNRERLWSEAVALYHEGIPAYLPAKLKELAEWSVREAV